VLARQLQPLAPPPFTVVLLGYSSQFVTGVLAVVSAAMWCKPHRDSREGRSPSPLADELASANLCAAELRVVGVKCTEAAMKSLPGRPDIDQLKRQERCSFCGAVDGACSRGGGRGQDTVASP